jgi:hypothetical protein
MYNYWTDDEIECLDATIDEFRDMDIRDRREFIASLFGWGDSETRTRMVEEWVVDQLPDLCEEGHPIDGDGVCRCC